MPTSGDVLADLDVDVLVKNLKEKFKMSSYLFVIMLFSSGPSFSIETADKESCNAVMAVVDKFLSEKSISAWTECREEFDI